MFHTLENCLIILIILSAFQILNIIIDFAKNGACHIIRGGTVDSYLKFETSGITPPYTVITNNSAFAYFLTNFSSTGGRIRLMKIQKFIIPFSVSLVLAS